MTATLRPGANEVSSFLVAHATALRTRGDEGSAANATFADAADAQLMRDIQIGDDNAFLAAADILGARLVAEMDHVGRPAPGLFVCTTLIPDGAQTTDSYAVVLKLEVVAPQGAVLQRLESGEETLSAVTNVLDQPGDLQKGLVYPDTRPSSEAVVGDKAAQHEARYFLRAMGVTLEAHESASAGALITAVASRVGRPVAEQVVAALPAVESAPAQEVLTALRESVPELTENVIAAVAQELASAERPVIRVDTAAPVRGKLRAGALTVSGPAEELRRVTWVPASDGGWTVTFVSEQEPQVTWR